MKPESRSRDGVRAVAYNALAGEMIEGDFWGLYQFQPSYSRKEVNGIQDKLLQSIMAFDEAQYKTAELIFLQGAPA